MSGDTHWIKTRITEARTRHASVTEAVLDRMDQLLNSELAERRLTPTELTNVAKVLIKDMVTNPLKTDTSR